jgi:ADP-ribose pyrophosphatase YjhB (NUDIX family)
MYSSIALSSVAAADLARAGPAPAAPGGPGHDTLLPAAGTGQARRPAGALPVAAHRLLAAAPAGVPPMQFCPRCATPLSLVHTGGRDRPTCRSCGYIFFGEFSIGVGGVVLRGGKALLIRRGHEPGRGWWQIPGGYAEADEEVVDAVEREVLEEAGIPARVVDVLGFRHSVGGPGSIGGPSTNVYIIFRLEPLDDREPSFDQDEITGVGYFSLEEIYANGRVQNLSIWGIETALLGASGLQTIHRNPDPRRPGWRLFGLPGRRFPGA